MFSINFEVEGGVKAGNLIPGNLHPGMKKFPVYPYIYGSIVRVCLLFHFSSAVCTKINNNKSPH